MRIHIEIDSDETDLAAVAKAIHALRHGALPKEDAYLEVAGSQIERSDQPGPFLPVPIGFQPEPEE